MWRRLLKRVHPDQGGSHEEFVWLQNVRDVIDGAESLAAGTNLCERCSGFTGAGKSHEPAEPAEGRRERVPFDPYECGDFALLSARAADIGRREGEPYASLLLLASEAPPPYTSRDELAARRGCTYKTLAYAAHLAGMDAAQRRRFYSLCEEAPLSQRHASYVIARLKEAAA